MNILIRLKISNLANCYGIEITIAIIIIIVYLIISTISTQKILRVEKYNQKQKSFQIIITWLLPLIGGFILLVINQKEKPLGSHIDKTPIWKRLVKYDENNPP